VAFVWIGPTRGGGRGAALLGHAEKRGAGSGPRGCWAAVEGALARLGLDHRLGLRSEREGRAGLAREKKIGRSSGPKEREGEESLFFYFKTYFKYEPNQI